MRGLLGSGSDTGSVRHAVTFSFLEKYGAAVLQFLSSLVLARLLTPHEIGVFSVGVAAVGLVHTFREFGVSNFLIQERELTDETVRTALTVTAALSWSLGVALILAAPALAGFYAEPGVGQVLTVVALNFFLIPFGSTGMALLRRHLRFRAVAVVNLLGALATAGVSTGLAAVGVGVMSLAWGAVAGVAVTVAAAVLYVRNFRHYVPCLRRWRRVLSFGGVATAAAFAGEVGQAAPDIILGRVLGFQAVGLFSRAMSLVTLLNRALYDALLAVAVPALAARLRAGEDIKEPIERTSAYVTAVVWPACAVLAILADPLILVLFGPQWEAAAPVARLLLVAAMVAAPVFAVQPALIAAGRIERVLHLRLVVVVPQVTLTLLLSPLGLKAVAAGWVVTALVSLWVSLRLLQPLVPLTWRELYRTGRPSFALVALAALPAVVGLALWNGSTASGLLVLAGVGVAGVALWLAGVVVLRHPVVKEVQRVAAWAGGRVGPAWAAALGRPLQRP